MTATFTLSAPFDMSAINFNDALHGAVTSESSTEVDITGQSGQHHYVFTGTDFNDFGEDGAPFFGTITGMTIDGVFTATGIMTGIVELADESPWNDDSFVGATINGSSGDDVIDAGVLDTVYGNDGNDVLDAFNHNDTLIGGKGNDVFNGYANPSEPFDTIVSYAGAAGGVKVYLALSGPHNVGSGQGDDSFNNIENVTGTKFADHLIGTALDNVLDGNGGIDTLGGGAGDDTLIAYDTSDTLNGGKGFDTVEFKLHSGLDYNTDQMVSVEHVVGTSFDDTIIGSGYAQTLQGGAGDDTLVGGAHNDTLIGGAGDDLLEGGGGFGNIASYAGSSQGVTVDLTISGPQFTSDSSGTDTLVGIQGLIGSGTGDMLTGDTANNHIFGENGNDVINGGAGNDIIEGGLGTDTMTGGAGADTFVYNDPVNPASSLTTPSSAPDLITDFDASQDHFQMDLFNGQIYPTAVSFVTTGQLDSGTNYHQEFDALLDTLGPSFQVALVTPDSGSLAGHHYLVVNVGLQADNIAFDELIELGTGSNLAGFGTQDFI